MNKHNSLLVVSSYPAQGEVHGTKTVGVASYAKNTLLALKKAQPNLQITVLAETLPDTSSSYSEDGMEIKRVWKRQFLLSYLSILNHIFYERKSKNILIEFELAMFGGSISLVFFPLFLLLLKLMGKHVFLVLHQVVWDMEELAPHIGLTPNSVKTVFITSFLRAWYRIITTLSYRVIVFESYLKKLLGTEKAVVIPHGVEDKTPSITRGEARTKLDIAQDEFVILYFGYLAWYKGVDWLVAQNRNPLKAQGKNVRVIVAGGPNPNHINKPFYKKYVEEIEKNAAANPNITYTGFVAEEDIETYFQASDVIILPYRTFMSSSGPLSIAFAYGKPVLLSTSLAPYAESADVKEVIGETKIEKTDLFFPMDNSPFNTTLSGITQEKLDKLSAFSDSMKEKRSFQRIGKQYASLLT